jgi:DNA-binding beta-propeller fold protein YncE
MNSDRAGAQGIIFVAILVWVMAGAAAGQNVLATVSIPAASAGQIAVDPALGMIYAGGGPNATSLTIIDGSTFKIVTTINPSAGVSSDMKTDNFWTGTLTGGEVTVYSGDSNTPIWSTSVGSCPAAVSFDCSKRRMWVASQCGSGSDPVWAFGADKLALLKGPISPGGTILQPLVVSPNTGKLYVTSGGVSREINPTSFAVSNTSFGTVMAVDSVTNKLFATSGNNLQIISGHADTVAETVPLTYTPAAIGVNNAMAHVYLLNSSANWIDIYSETGKLMSTIVLASTSQPTSIAVDSVRGRMFVDVLNTASNSWSLQVIEDLSTVRDCGHSGSCDY